MLWSSVSARVSLVLVAWEGSRLPFECHLPATPRSADLCPPLTPHHFLRTTGGPCFYDLWASYGVLQGPQEGHHYFIAQNNDWNFFPCQGDKESAWNQGRC